jgi:hypothetical protein
LQRVADGEAPPVNSKVNGNQHIMVYYRVDGICPSWSTLSRQYTEPQK